MNKEYFNQIKKLQEAISNLEEIEKFVKSEDATYKFAFLKYMTGSGMCTIDLPKILNERILKIVLEYKKTLEQEFEKL